MKQLAIMKNVSIGCRDIGTPCMFFETYIDESLAALQVLDWERAYEIIKKAGVYDFKSLEGSACWVECDSNLIRFLDICKI